jgi:predicted SprT family Zn-dependent metalloprotease
LQVVAYIESQGIQVGYARDEKSRRAGQAYPGRWSIDMWPTAYEIYGWDMMTSVLIHEFGHHKLYDAERIFEGIEAERKADEYGYRHMPIHLIPPRYEEHCAFFFQSNEAPGGWTTRNQVIEALDLWRSRQ